MTRPRPPSGGRHNHDSSEAKPERDRQPRLALRPFSSETGSHDSSEANP
jgi:hypothetical protein